MTRPFRQGTSNTSLIVELDPVVGVQVLAIPGDRSDAPAEPDLPLRRLNQLHHPARDHDPGQCDVGVLLHGVAVEIADFPGCNVPGILPGDAIMLVLNENERRPR